MLHINRCVQNVFIKKLRNYNVGDSVKVNYEFYDDKYKDDVIKLINDSFSNHSISNILVDDNVIGLVGLIDEKIVSYLNITICVDVIRNIKYALINYVCVHKEYRGNDLGKDLMIKAIEICKEKGCSKIELTSSSEKVAANKMYQGLGFNIRETNCYVKVI